MLKVRPAACPLRTDLFPTRLRAATDNLNISYTGTIPDDRIDAAATDYFDAGKSYLGITFHYIIMTDGTVEIGRDPRTLSSRGRSVAHRLDTIFIGVVGGLAFDDGKRLDTITEAQRETIAHLEQAIADALGKPLDVIDHTIEWTRRAEVDAVNEAKEAAFEAALDRAEEMAR